MILMITEKLKHTKLVENDSRKINQTKIGETEKLRMTSKPKYISRKFAYKKITKYEGMTN